MSHDEPMFRSAREAVRWALSDERAVIDASSLYAGIGKGGLAGYDAAGQAGIILAYVRRLNAPRSSMVIAQAASPKLPCSCRRNCCSGWRSNRTWAEAVGEVAQWWIQAHDPKCPRPRLVMACLRRHFGERIDLESIRRRNGCGRDVVMTVNGEALKVIKPAKELAWQEIESVLMEVGIVGTERPEAVAA